MVGKLVTPQLVASLEVSAPIVKDDDLYDSSWGPHWLLLLRAEVRVHVVFTLLKDILVSRDTPWIGWDPVAQHIRS
jgi:hypothetical protein